MPYGSGLIPLAATAAILQATPVPGGLGDIVAPAEHLTLVAVLVAGIKILWMSNARKEEEKAAIVKQLVENGQKVTEVMVTVIDAAKEMRKSGDEQGAAVDQLSDQIALLSATLTARGDCGNFVAIQPAKKKDQ